MPKIYNFNEIDTLIDKISDLVINTKTVKMIALIGDLGTGKTYLSKRICKNIGIEDNIKSPTFTYVLEYEKGDLKVFHLDLYRLSNLDELYEIGFDDFLEYDNSLFLIEWANNVPEILIETTLYIEFEYVDAKKRLISLYKMKEGRKEYVDINNFNFN